MVAPPTLGETWLINLHHLWDDVTIPIDSHATWKMYVCVYVCLQLICRRYLQLTYLSGVLNEPILADTSTHEPPMSLSVFCHPTALFVALKQWVFFCPAVDKGQKLHQGQLAVREQTAMPYWLLSSALTIWALPQHVVNLSGLLADGPQPVACFTCAGVGQ